MARASDSPHHEITADRRLCQKQQVNPRFTIITACRNSVDVLPICLDSVAGQTFNDYEHLVIDGASTDGTLDELRANDHERLRWISEPDCGIADAMNKGIAMAEGKWLLFLQSDDRLYSSTALQEIAERLPEEPSVLFFPVLREGAWGTRVHRTRPLWTIRLKIPACHQGMLFHVELFKRYGAYEESFRITMDYDFLLRVWRAGRRMERIRSIIPVAVGDAGISSSRSWSLHKERLCEEQRARLRHLRSWEQSLARAIFPLYLIYRRGVIAMKKS